MSICTSRAALRRAFVALCSLTIVSGAAAQAVTIVEPTYISAADASYDGFELTIDGTVVTIDGLHQFISLSLINGATVRHSNNIESPSVVRLDLVVASDLLVDSDSGFDLAGLGYGPDVGPGAGFVGEGAGSGAGYGGAGGASNEASGGSTYGLDVAPLELGSGGGSSFSVSGGAGGGGLYLKVGGQLNLQGFIIADGQDGAFITEQTGGGGGSGGGVFIETQSIAGEGYISAQGGLGGDKIGGGGGGGRVAVFTCDDTYSDNGWQVNVAGGAGFFDGDAGTRVFGQLDAPFVNAQPTPQTVTEGDMLMLSADVSGDLLSFQWYFNDRPLSDDGHVYGAQMASLTIYDVELSDAGWYILVIKGLCGMTTTEQTLVTVEPMTDCNVNGVHDAVDISENVSIDCNSNGAPDECETGRVGLTPDDSTVALYKFEEPYPEVSNDSSGNGNDAFDYGTTVVAGRFGSARQFDGLGDYITMGAAREALNGATALTIEFVAKSLDGVEIPFVTNNVCNAGWNLRVSGDQASFGFKTNSAGDCAWNFLTCITESCVTLPAMDDQWHYYALQWNGQAASLYRDGELLHTAPLDGLFESTQATDWEARIGWNDGTFGDDYASGVIDEMRVSNAARSGEEIADIYATLFTIDCNDNAIPDDCDVAGGASSDVNGDGVPDECQEFLSDVEQLYAYPDAGSVKLVWTPSELATGYIVYYGPAVRRETPIVASTRISGLNLQSVDVGDVSEAVISGLTNGVRYVFYLTAYDASGAETDGVRRFSTPSAGVGGLYAQYSNGVKTIEAPIFHGYWGEGCYDTDENLYQGVCTPVSESPVDWAWGDDVSVCWKGYIYVPVGGTYQFNSYYWVDGVVYIEIDGFVVADFNTTGGGYSASLDLVEGEWVPVAMAFDANGGSNNMHLGWTPPDGDWTPIPGKYLAYFADCNGNYEPDADDIANGVSLDCNKNGQPDECDIAEEVSSDVNANSVPDECDPDCNANGVPDDLDVLSDGDCNSNGVPDECETDTDGDGLIDACDDTPNGDDQGGQDPATGCCLSCNVARAISGEEVDPCFTEYLDEHDLTLEDLIILLSQQDDDGDDQSGDDQSGDDQSGQDAPLDSTCPLTCFVMLTLSIIGLRGGRKR